MQAGMGNTLKRRLIEWLTAHGGPFVLGLSGGLDSAVAGAVAALTGIETVGFWLPNGPSDPNKFDAHWVATRFGIKWQECDIEPIYRACFLDPGLALLSRQIACSGAKIAEANLLSRIRMTILYYYANLTGAKVIGTRHGDDGAADLYPLRKISKSIIKELAYELGVPESIIAKEPSAGLWEGQTDAEEIGCCYELVDTFLDSTVGTTDDDPTDIEKSLQARIENTEHKRQTYVFYPEKQD